MEGIGATGAFDRSTDCLMLMCPLEIARKPLIGFFQAKHLLTGRRS